MSGCDQCGQPTRRRGLCKDCALADRYSSGPVGGTGSDDEAEWSVNQEGLGDAEAEGQARLDGGIVKEGGDDA